MGKGASVGNGSTYNNGAGGLATGKGDPLPVIHGEFCVCRWCLMGQK